MRIGVYIDGFNLYYGARGLCGRGTPGWRWIDLRALATDLVGRRTNWAGARVERVVYCTARIDAAGNPSGHADQDVYLKALLAAGSVDHIEYGTYVARVRSAPLAVKDRQGRPRIVSSDWPVMVQDGQGGNVDGAVFMVSYADREESCHIPPGSSWAGFSLSWHRLPSSQRQPTCPLRMKVAMWRLARRAEHDLAWDAVVAFRRPYAGAV